MSDLTKNEIIDRALALLDGGRHWSKKNWLTDLEDFLVETNAPGAGCRACLDGALNLAARGLNFENATLDDAAEEPCPVLTGLTQAKQALVNVLGGGWGYGTPISPIISLNERAGRRNDFSEIERVLKEAKDA